MTLIALSIPGIPASKGNWIAVNGVFIPQNKEKLNAWTHTIKQAAKYTNGQTAPSKEPIALKISFYMPAGSQQAGACITRPDIDKLSRAVMDALTGIIYEDDRQVISLTATKEYSQDGAPGCEIEISEVI